MSRAADEETRRAPVVPAVRGLLLLAAVLVFLAGVQLFVFPTRTAEWFAWTIDVPMTAVFLGASYWASAVLEVSGARAPHWGRARIAVWAVMVFTTLTLVVTLVHLDKFHLGAAHPTSARVVTWGWLAVYAVVPVALLGGALLQARRVGRGPPTDPADRRLPEGLRALLVVLAVVLVGAGVALLVSPGDAAAWWPWQLTPLTGRAIGAWLVGLGWAAGHAALIDGAAAVRPLGWTGVTFVVLQGVALARHGDALEWSEPVAATYVTTLLAIGVASAWILLLRPDR